MRPQSNVNRRRIYPERSRRVTPRRATRSSAREPLRIGLLGPGRIAEKSIAPAIAASAAARLEVVGSRSLERAQALARPFHARAVAGYDAVVQDPSVECVYIALPNALHAEWALKAAAAGKHVLCEKPACQSLAETERVVAACRRAGGRFMEGYMFRSHPQHAQVRERLRRGELGEVHHLEAAFGFPPLPQEDFRYQRTLGGGALADLAGYPIAAARLLFGEEPEGVSALAEGDPAYGVDIRGTLQLRFPSGRTAQAAFGFPYSYRNTYALWGSRGRLEVARAFSIPPTLNPSITLMTEQGVTAIPSQPGDHFRLMIDTFCDAVRSSTRTDDGHEADALAQARVMDAVRESARQHGAYIGIPSGPPAKKFSHT